MDHRCVLLLGIIMALLHVMESSTLLSTHASMLRRGLRTHHEALSARRAKSLASLNAASKSLATALRKALLKGKHKINVEIPVYEYADLARAQLAEEAERLKAKDAYGASLLRTYGALTPPDVLLLAAPEDEGPFSEASLESADGDVENSQGSVSEETIVTDGQGHSTTRTTHCKNGACMQKTITGTGMLHGDGIGRQPEDLASAGAVGFDPLAGATADDIGIDPLAGAMRHIMHAMRAVERSMGHQGLGKILRAGSTASSGRDFIDEMNNATNGEKATREAHKDATVPGVIESEETTIANGQMVTHRKHCSHGHCNVSVTKKHIEPSSEDRDPEPPTPHVHVIPVVFPGPGESRSALPGGKLPAFGLPDLPVSGSHRRSDTEDVKPI